MGATLKRSLGVCGNGFEGTPKRVWRRRPFPGNGAVAANVSV